MSEIYRRLKTRIVNGFYWQLDYWYVFRRQIKGLFSQSKSDKYLLPDSKEHPVSVLLIPGIYERWQFMEPIAKLLHDNGYDIHVIDDLGYNRGSVEEMAIKISDYLSKNEDKNFVIVSHSKGGLIGKYLLALHSPGYQLKGMISLNTPYSGSIYARLIPVKALRIFTPNSPILQALTRESEANSRIVSISGLFDPHIPNGSFLEGSKNIQLNTYGHFRVIDDPSVHKAILEELNRLARI